MSTMLLMPVGEVLTIPEADQRTSTLHILCERTGLQRLFFQEHLPELIALSTMNQSIQPRLNLHAKRLTVRATRLRAFV